MSENSIEKKMKARKNQMFFGLAVEAFQKLKQDKENSSLKSSYEEIEKALTKDFREFTEVFLSAHTIDAEDFWRWSFILEEIPEGKPSFIDITGKLEEYYVVRGLKLLSNMSEEEIKRINLDFENKENRDLALSSENLVKILDEIHKREEWSFILNEEEIDKINDFKSLLKKSEEIWEEKEKEIMRKREISQDKVGKFKNEVIEGFDQWKNMRSIFEHFSLFKNKPNEKKDIKRFGTNKIDDKAAFFERWHVRYPNWGYEHGKSMAIGENTNIFKFLSEQCENIQEDKFEDILNIFDSLSDLLILITGSKSLNFVTGSKKFKQRYECPKPDLDKLLSFRGCYVQKNIDIPVFGIITNDIDQILITNSKLGNLIQYSPLNKNDDANLIRDSFYMNIRAFSENKDIIEDFLRKSIGWLEKVGDETEQRKYLEEKVWIQIIERFEYQKDKDFSGYSLKFNED